MTKTILEITREAKPSQTINEWADAINERYQELMQSKDKLTPEVCVGLITNDFSKAEKEDWKKFNRLAMQYMDETIKKNGLHYQLMQTLLMITTSHQVALSQSTQPRLRFYDEFIQATLDTTKQKQTENKTASHHQALRQTTLLYYAKLTNTPENKDDKLAQNKIQILKQLLKCLGYTLKGDEIIAPTVTEKDKDWQSEIDAFHACLAKKNSAGLSHQEILCQHRSVVSQLLSVATTFTSLGIARVPTEGERFLNGVKYLQETFEAEPSMTLKP